MPKAIEYSQCQNDVVRRLLSPEDADLGHLKSAQAEINIPALKGGVLWMS